MRRAITLTEQPVTIPPFDEKTIDRLDWPSLSSQLRAGASPLDLRKELAASGILAIDCPLWLGRLPLAFGRIAEIFEAAGAAGLELRDVIGLGHARLLALANGRRHAELLRECANGKSFWAICITEPGAGSDLAGISTAALPAEKGYIICGVKRYVSRIEEASHYLVFAKVPRSNEERLSVFVVPSASPGIKLAPLKPTGLSTTSWGEIRFHDVFVPESARVGGEGQGFQLFHRHFAYWRTMMAALAVGAASKVLKMCGSELNSRQAFGAPIGRFTHLQQEYASHLSKVHMARLLVHDTCRRVERNIEAPRFGAMAKAETVEIALGVAHWALLMFGARGIEEKAGLSGLQRDLVALRIADGPTDVLRTQVARGALGEDLYRRALGRRSRS